MCLQVDGTIEKRFAKKEVLYPVEVRVCACVRDVCGRGPKRGGGLSGAMMRRSGVHGAGGLLCVAENRQQSLGAHQSTTTVTLCSPPPSPLPSPQLVVRRNPAPDPRFQPETAAASLAAYDLKPGASALFLGRSHYGCLATVLPDASTGLTRKVCVGMLVCVCPVAAAGVQGGRGMGREGAASGAWLHCSTSARRYQHEQLALAHDLTQHPLASSSSSLLQGKQLVAGGGGGSGPFRISLQPGPSNMATIAQSGEWLGQWLGCGVREGSGVLRGLAGWVLAVAVEVGAPVGCAHTHRCVGVLVCFVSACPHTAPATVCCRQPLPLPLPLSPPCCTAARRVLGNVNVQYVPSGQVSRRLGVSHRVLGRLTCEAGGQASWSPVGCMPACPVPACREATVRPHSTRLTARSTACSRPPPPPLAPVVPLHLPSYPSPPLHLNLSAP